jgi:hypothetical protein
MDLPVAARRLKQEWLNFFEHVPRPARCPCCGGRRVHWNGSRTRKVTVLVGRRSIELSGVRCRRVRCALCRTSWTLRPRGLAPRRQFQLCVVARATSRYLFAAKASLSITAAEHGCSPRSLGRWLTWVGSLASPAALQRRLVEVAGRPLLTSFREVAELGRKATSAPRRRRLALAAQVLVLVEALGHAIGAEPPGLRGVLERVVAGRDRVTTESHPRVPELAAREAGQGLGTIPM